MMRYFKLSAPPYNKILHQSEILTSRWRSTPSTFFLSFGPRRWTARANWRRPLYPCRTTPAISAGEYQIRYAAVAPSWKPMTDRYFFEIPIYRCEEDSYYDDYSDAKKNHLDRMSRAWIGRTPDLNWLMQVEEEFRKRYGGPWRYNQVVGWMRLHVLGTQIRGELWVADSKRFLRKMKKRFEFVGKDFELSCRTEMTSTEIVERLRREFERFDREWRNGRCCLDLSHFDEIAPYVDWVTLVRPSPAA